MLSVKELVNASEMIEYTEGIKDSLDSIFGAILIGELNADNPCKKQIVDSAKICFKRFKESFNYNVFTNEYAVLFDLLITKSARVVKNSQIKEIVYASKDLIEVSPFIRLDRYIRGDISVQPNRDELIELFLMDLLEKNDTLSNRYVSEDEFDTAVKIFCTWYRHELIKKISNNSALIMSDEGFDWIRKNGKRVHLKGVDDVREYQTYYYNIVDSLDEERQSHSYVIDEKWLNEDLKKDDAPDEMKLLQFGIPEIDRVVHWLRRGNMLGILGPPKGGKTRLSAFLSALALYKGLNVAVWPLEGSKEEWESMIIASLMALIQVDEGVDRDEQGRRTFLASNVILNREYPNAQVRKEVNAIKTKLALDEKMGRLSFLSGVAYSDTFTQELDRHYKEENPFDVIVIDSLVNITSSSTGGGSKTENISRAFMSCKNYITNVMKTPALAIIPEQLKQDAIDKLRANPDADIDVTAGGESAETIRTPDFILGLFGSKQERKAGKLHIYSVAARHSEDFDDFMVNAVFASCYFFSNE